jgi:hypothetical protein
MDTLVLVDEADVGHSSIVGRERDRHTGTRHAGQRMLG